MKKSDVKLNAVYLVKVSGNLAPVRLLRESPYGGWDARNEITHRDVRVKTAARLRRAVRQCPGCRKWDYEAYMVDGVCHLCKVAVPEATA